MLVGVEVGVVGVLQLKTTLSISVLFALQLSSELYAFFSDNVQSNQRKSVTGTLK